MGLLLFSSVSLAEEELYIPVDDQEMTVRHYPAEGTELIIWIAPSFGTSERVTSTARAFAKSGIEVWHVDLSESLFLPASVTTLRKLDGHYVAGLIDAAYEKTGKRVTLLSRAYATLPALKGARQWQVKHANDDADHFNGAILFSPETYLSIPTLGMMPEYDPIVSATNIPIMVFQGGVRGNRWQLADFLERIYSGGAQAYVRVMPGVAGIFYSGDTSPATLAMLDKIPVEINAALHFLASLNVPKQAVPLEENTRRLTRGLDIALKKYKGDPSPLPLDLYTAEGERVVRDDYRGKVTLVNFWATWCPPCVEEIPSLNNLRKEMQGKPFELISVNYAQDKKVIEKFLREINVDFPVLLDTDGRVSVKWGVIAYPSTFVIGPDGKIHYGVNAAIHWDSPEVIDAMNDLLK